MSKSAAKSFTLISYKEGLSNADRKRYDEKLMHIGGCDPYEEKLDWTNNVDILPSVTYPDIVTYLLFSPSVYSADELKAYKSLDAYNQFVCGWVRDTGSIRYGDNVVVSAKVLHSQRMREKPLRPWIIAKNDGTIVTAHCNCMAGLGEACSHVAALLFYIEAAVKIRDSKTVTEEKAYWLLPSACRSIQPKTIFEIDFVSAKTAKKQFDNRIEAASSSTPITPASSTKKRKLVPVASSDDFLNFCQGLSNISSNPAILAIVEPSANKYVPKQDKKDYPIILTEMRDEDCLKLNYKELSDKCANISITCSKLQAENVEEETRGQSKSKFWHSFRAGRITASRAKAVVSTNKAAPSQSLVKDICYPGDRKVETPATKWGCDHEKDAIEKFMEEIGPLHENSRLQNSGFVISQDIPYIGASPDAIFMCDCCGLACVEVKCPYNARCAEINENTNPFLHRQNNELELKHDHQYYYQVQTQLGVSKHEVGYFVVWTENSLHVEAIMFDNQLWDRICASAKEIMYSAVLQELVGKFFTRMPVTTNVLQSIENSSNGNKGQITKKGASDKIHTKSEMTENDEALYCFCNQVEHGKMIGCDNEACEIEWFHYRCVNISTEPKGKWFCPDCRKLPNFKRRR